MLQCLQQIIHETNRHLTDLRLIICIELLHRTWGGYVYLDLRPSQRPTKRKNSTINCEVSWLSFIKSVLPRNVSQHNTHKKHIVHVSNSLLAITGNVSSRVWILNIAIMPTWNSRCKNYAQWPNDMLFLDVWLGVIVKCWNLHAIQFIPASAAVGKHLQRQGSKCQGGTTRVFVSTMYTIACTYVHVFSDLVLPAVTFNYINYSILVYLHECTPPARFHGFGLGWIHLWQANLPAAVDSWLVCSWR